MSSPKKAPRRTAERVLESALGLFNRFGEPNVSTALIAADLGISPGNLHYHYPTKDALIDRLVDRYVAELESLLPAAADVRQVEDAWLFFHMLFELVWRNRFLYRDLNDLLSNNRRLEASFQASLQAKEQAMKAVLCGLERGGALGPGGLGPAEAESVATALAVLLTYWLSYEYVRDPRHALEPESASSALLRGAFLTLGLLRPYLDAEQAAHLDTIAGPYDRLVPPPVGAARGLRAAPSRAPRPHGVPAR